MSQIRTNQFRSWLHDFTFLKEKVIGFGNNFEVSVCKGSSSDNDKLFIENLSLDFLEVCNMRKIL